MELTPIVKGFASYIPGLYDWRDRRRVSHRTTAQYSYHRWLGHLALLNQRHSCPVPATVAELGPGASLGVGLAALLSGADTYLALDLVKYSDIESNAELLRELVTLFRSRAPLDWTWLHDSLGMPTDFDTAFPRQVLTDEVLADSLADSRIDEIFRALEAPDGRSGSITIEYTVPWTDPAVIRRGSVDLIISNSVLEHIDDLDGTYDAFAQWLKAGGRMSHAIDFRSHALTKIWNGHWEYSEPVWRMIVGRKPYLINRKPCSHHIAMMAERGFNITLELQQRTAGIPRNKLAARWQDMADDDLTCSAAILQTRLNVSN